MKLRKISCVIRVETLSVDSIGSIVCEALGRIGDENQAGLLRKDDGDQVEWDITTGVEQEI